MFTGIIEALGKVDAVERRGVDARLRIDAQTLDLADVRIGDSIAVNGICLTVIELAARVFAADVSVETLTRTTLGEWKPGTTVNLEKALLPTTRLGGHLVSGHVDGVGIVREHVEDGRSVRFRVELPQALAKYVAEKGSICVDGVSLTVNAIDRDAFDVNIVPHTAQKTTFGKLRTNQKVNLEVDVLARYLERMMLGDSTVDTKPEFTRELLARYGYLK